MKTISLIAVGVLALGWGTASAETSPSSVTSDPPDATTPPPHVNVDVDAEETTTEPTTNVEVNAPPVNVDANVNPIVPIVVPAPVETRQVADPSVAVSIDRQSRRGAADFSSGAASRISPTTVSGA